MRHLKKAELHAHLNGCIPTDKVRELIVRFGVRIPARFDVQTDLNVLAPVKSLRRYFKPWKVLKKLPQGRECLREMVLAACQSLAHDNVVYAELRNSPFNIPRLNSISLHESLEWLTSAVEDAAVLCGVKCKLVLSITRHKFHPNHAPELLQAIKRVNSRRTIVGMDISGDEDAPIDKDIARFFRKAKGELGLGITIHAGETGRLENVRWAIEHCSADRLGHGLAIAKSPKVMQKVVARDICVEVCLTSNLRSGQVRRIEEHPIRRFIDFDIPFVLCSDNPQVHCATLSDEYELFIQHFNRRDLIDGMHEKQIQYSFATKLNRVQ